MRFLCNSRVLAAAYCENFGVYASIPCHLQNRWVCVSLWEGSRFLFPSLSLGDLTFVVREDLDTFFTLLCFIKRVRVYLRLIWSLVLCEILNFSCNFRIP